MVEEITGNGVTIDFKILNIIVSRLETLNLIGWGFFVALKKRCITLWGYCITLRGCNTCPGKLMNQVLTSRGCCYLE